MRKKLLYIVFISLALLSCSDKIVIVVCTDCTPDEPVKTDVIIKLEPGSWSMVKLSVFLGNIEDSVMIDSFYTGNDVENYSCFVNTKYKFRAEYFSPSTKKINVVDSAYPRVKYEADQCDNPCYYVYDNKINLKVRYY